MKKLLLQHISTLHKLTLGLRALDRSHDEVSRTQRSLGEQVSALHVKVSSQVSGIAATCEYLEDCMAANQTNDHSLIDEIRSLRPSEGSLVGKVTDSSPHITGGSDNQSSIASSSVPLPSKVLDSANPRMVRVAGLCLAAPRKTHILLCAWAKGNLIAVGPRDSVLLRPYGGTRSFGILFPSGTSA